MPFRAGRHLAASPDVDALLPIINRKGKATRPAIVSVEPGGENRPCRGISLVKIFPLSDDNDGGTLIKNMADLGDAVGADAGCF